MLSAPMNQSVSELGSFALPVTNVFFQKDQGHLNLPNNLGTLNIPIGAQHVDVRFNR